MKGMLLGIPISSLEPTQRKVREDLATPIKVSRQRGRVRRRGEHWSTQSGSLNAVWRNGGGESGWGPFQKNDDEQDLVARREIRWMRIVFAVAALGRTGVHAAERVLDTFDEPWPDLTYLTPFIATEYDDEYADLVALLTLTGGARVEPDSIQERRFQDFKATRDFVNDALAGVPEAERVYRQIAILEPREMLIRVIFSCRDVEEGGGETLMDWYRQGRFDEIERAIPTVVERSRSQRPW